MFAGALVVLVLAAWAVRDAPGEPATQSSVTMITAAELAPRGEAEEVQAAAPAPPVVTPERRQMARMSLKRVAVTNGGGRQRLVALSLDDGPGPLTMEFLETLERLEVPATFYVQGSLLDTHTEEVRAMIAGGHEVGAHGWSHRDLTGTYGDDFEREVAGAQARIRTIAGVDPGTMRPPYGAIDDRVLRDAAPTRMLQVLWDVDTDDWRGNSAKQIADHVIANATAGSIILMHEGAPSRRPTLKALPVIVRGLRAKGLEFVTVTELLMRDPPRELREQPSAAEPGTATDGAGVSAPEPARPSSAPGPYSAE
jgi:peptidoglycan/xylan/chitin deacetylase (PgdA/CDA1 family)